MRRCYLLLIALLGWEISQAQDNVIAKSGWNFGGLPTVTFDSDLGFQYGALVNVYNYGDGSRYPNYNHSLYFEVSRFTKGSGINRFFYDSDQLIEGLQTSFDLSYLTDRAYDFYGYNGYNSVINPDLLDKENPSRYFYRYDRKLFRAKLDLQGAFAGSNMRWTAGFNLQNFAISSIDFDRLNEGKANDEKLAVENGLYDIYKDMGVISAEEADGGFVPVLKGGIVYDTRDNRPNPMKGIWTEAIVEAAPGMISSSNSFAKFAFIHRQYFTLVPNDLSLVYRIAYQSTLAGDVPFYYQSQMMTSFLNGVYSEGLGGSKSIRGMYRNRVIGDGIVYGNVEMRWKFVRFNFINNNFYLALNGFTDFGQVVNPIEVKAVNSSSIYRLSDYYTTGLEKMHFSYGGGLRIVMNENFVIAADYGRAVDPQDGTSGMYIGLNYLF